MNKNHEYGFQWNNLSVYRICSDKKFGSYLAIESNKQTMEIRITSGGKISVVNHRKHSPNNRMVQ